MVALKNIPIILLYIFILGQVQAAEPKAKVDVQVEGKKSKKENLQTAIADGDIDKVKKFIEEGADVNAKDEIGRVPLNFVKNKAVAELLIAKGADVNARTKDGSTLLHTMAWNGNKEMVELLLENGADVNANHNKGHTPLHFAVRTGNKEVVKLLLTNGSRVNTKDEWGYTSLHWAVKKGYRNIAELLLANGADASDSNWPMYVDKKRGFRFKYPQSWKITTGRQLIRHYRDTFIALNGAAQENLWITQKEVSPGSWLYSDKTVADQLPKGCVYMDIGWWEGPPGPRFGPGITEMSSNNLADLLAEAPEEPTSDSRLTTRKLEFSKWGRRWSIFVYFREPVSKSNKAEIEKVLKSFRFEANPVGDGIWAIWKARQHLPSEAEPDTFVREGGNEFSHVQTENKGNDIYVTFTKAYPEKKDRRKTWKYRVTDSGKVIPITKEEGFVRDNNSQESTIKWIDEESGEELFDIGDIVRFDWNKQVFELTRRSAMDFMAELGSLGVYGRKFILKDGMTVIYDGTLVNPISSFAFVGPVIRSTLPDDNVKPPLFKIGGGYPRDSAKGDSRFSGRLNKVLNQAGLLGEIDLKNPPALIKKDSHGWYGIKGGLRVWVDVFPETFRLRRTARAHIHITGIKYPDKNHVVDVNATLISKDGKGTFSTKKVFPFHDSGWKNIYVLEMNPWEDTEGSSGRVKPEGAKLSIEVFTRRVLDELTKTYSELIDRVKTDAINVWVEPGTEKVNEPYGVDPNCQECD